MAERQKQRKRQPSVVGGQHGRAELPTESEPLAIETLITCRCRDLGLNKARLVRLAGFKNGAKGIRRLDDLLAGELETTRTLI